MQSDPLLDAANIKLDKTDYEKLASFRYTLRRFLRFSEQAAVAAGLTPHQHQALLAVHAMPGRDFATVGELAVRLQIRPNTALELAARLEKEGLLTRRKADTDRRAVELRMTSKGLEKLQRLSLAHREELTRLAPELIENLAAISQDQND